MHGAAGARVKRFAYPMNAGIWIKKKKTAHKRAAKQKLFKFILYARRLKSQWS